MKVMATPLPGVLVLDPSIHRDDRGFFLEAWHAGRYAAAGIWQTFVQDNHSHSRRGVLRGLHYQVGHVQGKLVRVAAGAIFDVAVDLRRSSPTFGQWTGVTLSAETGRQLWIPPGFAHGFYVIDDSADVLYKCSAFHRAEDERTLRWDDPAVGVAWPLAGGAPPIVSARDAAGSPLAEAATFP